jgi:hypothetical protein
MLVERGAAQSEGRESRSEEWLIEQQHVFILTDDDDELNTWGQAGTLDGLQGPVVGYTALVEHGDGQRTRSWRCEGAVSPKYRHQRGGRLLLQGALNRARMLTSDEDEPVYFEALLPANDPGSPQLATYFEMRPVEEQGAMRLYRREL